MNIQRVLKKINPHRLMQLAIVLLLATSLFSCSKDNDPGPEELEEEIGNLPGLGEKSGSPLGAQFTLPDGVTVDGEIRGGICQEAEIQIGSGLLVTVCIGLRNDNDDEKTITFPGGLILISTTDSYQNGIVVKDETIVIPPRQPSALSFTPIAGTRHGHQPTVAQFTLSDR
ncbi:hypothetical protein [Parapedobacter tibetensis]|uniref:hypothetical protein n=1 Tax=Parapedobacter tibetensis TaxID=2972951 RepID=UPI00214DC0D5|nr:hypothetical protein [Parapedobacter tibetensis]